LNRSTEDKLAAAEKALAVRLGEDLHAIPITAIEEVLPALPIESIPQCPAFVRGVVSVRGHLIPVLDAAERLGLEGHQRPAEPHIVCVRVGGRLVGLEVDEALDLIDLSPATLVPAEDIGASAGFFAGVVELDDQVVRILDPQRLLAREETAELERMPRTTS
jgi:purine-binding chemotaxis protein CheW